MTVYVAMWHGFIANFGNPTEGANAILQCSKLNG